MREYGEKAYEFSESYITVTILFDRTGFNTANGEINGEIKLEEAVLNLIKSNLQISRPQIAEKLNMSLRSIDRAIQNLKKEGSIQGRTSYKNGKWIVN